MIKLVLELFVLYIIYKFVFELIIPVYKTTKHIKKKMNEMNDHLENQQRKNQSFSSSNTDKKKEKNNDYIDYEEIK
jgi:Sec-independent protein translocase protein TatA